MNRICVYIGKYNNGIDIYHKSKSFIVESFQ